MLLLIVAITALAIYTPTILAADAQGKAKGKKNEQADVGGKHKSQEHKDVDKEIKHSDKNDVKEQKKENRELENDRVHNQGWERRDKFEYRTYADADPRPPGWSRGKKTGWDNCGVPPGQAKKGECRTYRYQGKRYYYYRDDDGRMIIRRPFVNSSPR
jgi:hypothetical protein